MGSQVDVARALGITERTVQRYEAADGEGAPRWYMLALEGLAARLRGKEKSPAE